MGHVRSGLRIHCFQSLHGTVTEPVPIRFIPGVGGICAKGFSPFRQIGKDILFACFQQRPDIQAALGRHAPQPSKAGTTDQVHKHRFRLILPMMTQCHGLCPGPGGGPAKKPVAKLSCGTFHADPLLPGGARHVPSFKQKGDPQSLAQGLAKCQIPLRLFPADAVVIMGGIYGPQLPLPGKPSQFQHQSGGICSAGKGRQHSAVFMEAAAPKNSRADQLHKFLQ